MSDREIVEFIRSFNEPKEVASSKKKSQEYLQSVGLYTKKGNLRKEYKAPCTAKKTP